MRSLNSRMRNELIVSTSSAVAGMRGEYNSINGSRMFKLSEYTVTKRLRYRVNKRSRARVGPHPFIFPDREEAYQLLIIPSDFSPLSIVNIIRNPSLNLDPNFSIFSIRRSPFHLKELEFINQITFNEKICITESKFRI